MSKLMSLRDAVKLISDGALLALGGNTLNRAPMAAVAELVRQEKRGLRLVKTAGAMDVDMLSLSDGLASVDAGFISYESYFGLCRHYRRGVERGTIQANEHACYTVISALRAAAFGLPFMPVAGLNESDLCRVHPYFSKVKDPFSDQEVRVVRALRPDVAILHVQQADEAGNARIEGPEYEDILISRAAAKVFITSEEIVPEGFFRRQDLKAQIPHFLVQGVVHQPRGAFPGSCPGRYPADEKEILSFLALQDLQSLTSWLHERRRVMG